MTLTPKRAVWTLPYCSRCLYQTPKRANHPWIRVQSVEHPTPNTPHGRRASQHQHRFFSAGRPHAAKFQNVRYNPKPPSAPSLGVKQKQQINDLMRSGKFPEDVGLLPGTFILPRAFSERWNWTLRKKWAVQRIQEIAGLAYFRFASFKPNPALDLLTLPSIAKDLHAKMFTAFASGNLQSVSDSVCDGILGSLERRIALRPPHQSMEWKILKRFGKPKLVSYRASLFPGMDKAPKEERSGMIQAVVQIRSVQSLRPVQRARKFEHGRWVTSEVPTNVMQQEKETVEYLVVQRIIRRTEPGPWKIWGFTKESKLSDLDTNTSKSGRAPSATPTSQIANQ